MKYKLHILSNEEVEHMELRLSNSDSDVEDRGAPSYRQ